MIVPEGTEVMDMSEAFAASVAESEPASSPVAETVMPTDEAQAPADGEQATVDAQGQPTAEEHGFSDEGLALADLLDDTAQASQDSSAAGGLTPDSEGFWNQSVEVKTVNGQESVELKELRDGYLRQADYTQKTQALAEERKRTEQAAEFLTAFETDPHGFVRSLAVQAGLVEEGSAPVKEIPLVAMPTQEAIDQLIEQKVEERYKVDPRVQSVQLKEAERQVSEEFDKIEQKYGVPLKPSVRKKVIQEAIDTGNANLDGIVASKLFQLQQKQAQANQLNKSATNRPGNTPSTDDAPSASNRPMTMAEAMEQAEIELAQQ
jgi:hypothetical protein